MSTKPINNNNNNVDDDTEEDVHLDIDSEETEPLSESELPTPKSLCTENNTNQQNIIVNSVSIEHELTEEMIEETIDIEQAELPRTGKITKKITEKIDLKQIQSQKQKLITDYLTSSNMKTRKQKRGVGINYLFYSGVIPSKPEGAKIDEIHRLWWFDYQKLEEHHGYIQWLFPIFDSNGTNLFAEPLTTEEADLIRNDFQCAIRIVKSYRYSTINLTMYKNVNTNEFLHRMMLNFYGLELVDDNDGKFLYSRNFFGDRILKSLGELGFARYTIPLIELLKYEVYVSKELQRCRYSFENYWEKTLHEKVTKSSNVKKQSHSQQCQESIFFKHMIQNTPEWKQYQKEWEEFVEQQMKIRQISDEQEVKDFESYMTKKIKEKGNTNTKDNETLSNNEDKNQIQEDNGKTKHRRNLNDTSRQKQNCRSRKDPRMRR